MSDIRKMSVGELARAWKTSTIGTELARRLEAAEAARDRWKTEALAARPFIDMGCIEAWQPDGFHPGIPTHIAYKAARAANGEVGQ